MNIILPALALALLLACPGRFGGAGGEVADNGGTCTSPDVGRYLDARADDLQAALRSVGRRLDADMDRMLAVDDSAGGAAIATLGAACRRGQRFGRPHPCWAVPA